MTCTSIRSTRNLHRVRCGVYQTHLLRHSRNWTRFRNLRRRRNWESSWRLSSRPSRWGGTGRARFFSAEAKIEPHLATRKNSSFRSRSLIKEQLLATTTSSNRCAGSLVQTSSKTELAVRSSVEADLQSGKHSGSATVSAQLVMTAKESCISSR